jgi:hypothetical protein
MNFDLGHFMFFSLNLSSSGVILHINICGGGRKGVGTSY